jgi:hypothetical protein
MKNPIQPLAKDPHGVLRFKANAIVRHLLDTHPSCDMNKLACMDFTDDDRRQFLQLIGFSLSGYSEFDYVDDVEPQTTATTLKGVDRLIQAAQSAARAEDQGVGEDEQYWVQELARLRADMITLLGSGLPAVR